MALGEYLRLSLRNGIARVRDAAYGLRASPSAPGDLPDRGVVAVEGRVEAADRVLRSPVTDAACVVVGYRLEARAGEDARPWVLRDRIVAVPFFVTDDWTAAAADGRSHGRAEDRPAGGTEDPAAGVAGDPTADGGRALVDVVPRRLDEDLAAGPRSRGRAAYVDSTIDFPSGSETVREARVGDLAPADPLAGFPGWGDPDAPDSTGVADLPDATRIRYVERRFEPGHRVSVLGHRLPGGYHRPDVANVRGFRSPFRLSG